MTQIPTPQPGNPSRPTASGKPVKTLSGYKSDYAAYSGLASEVGRKVAFAGIAVVWIFKLNLDPPRPPEDLIGPLAFFVFGLAADFLQYAIGTATWGIFHWAHERKLKNVARDDPPMAHPKLLPLPIHICFVVKLTCYAVGFVWLAIFLGWLWICTPSVA